MSNSMINPFHRELQSVPIDDIIVIQTRIRLNPDVVAEYTALIGPDGASPLPPITLFCDPKDGVLRCPDGHHRIEAHKAAKLSEIRAHVEDGSEEQATLHAVGANATHGLPRSCEDKRNAVSLLLELPGWAEQSSRAIATQCGVSHVFVEKMRRDHAASERPVDGPAVEDGHPVPTGNVTSSLRTGQDGRRRRRPEKRSQSTSPATNTDRTPEQCPAQLIELTPPSPAVDSTASESKTPEGGLAKPALSSFENALASITSADATVRKTIPHLGRERLNELLAQLNRIGQWVEAVRHEVAEAIARFPVNETHKCDHSSTEEVSQSHPTESPLIERIDDQWYVILLGQRMGPFHAKRVAREYIREHFSSDKNSPVRDTHAEKMLAS